MGPDAVAIFVGGRLAVRSADTEYPFRQDSDFWYLTGFDHPDAVAVLSTREGPDFRLFVQPRDRDAEIWTGYRPGVEGAVADYDADEAHPIEELHATLPELLRGAKRIYHALGRDKSLDDRIVALQEEIRRQSRGGVLPAEELVDPRRIVHEMRLRKSDEEIAIMQRAAAISLEGHHRAARICHPGRFEYELEAELEYAFRARGGAGPAYGSIVGSGRNATILHYIRNDQPLRENEVVLIDAGVELEGYASDVTRCYPVGGTFTGAARTLYDLVLAANQASLEASRPGTTLPEVHAASVEVLTQGMVDLGLLEGDVDELIEKEAHRRYYMHGTSHWLGLDVHDVGAYVVEEDGKANPRPLAKGMAYTIEPGLYVAEDDEQAPEAYRGIGIRIEDDVVVTDDGILNLTRDIPKQADDIEAWVQSGLLDARGASQRPQQGPLPTMADIDIPAGRGNAQVQARLRTFSKPGQLEPQEGRRRAIGSSAPAEPPAKFWAKMAKENVSLVHALEEDAPVEASLRQVVRRRQDERLLQLPRSPPRRRRPRPAGSPARTRPRSSGKASPATLASSPTPSSTEEVCRFANVLKAQGVKKGDRVCLYMPMVPELGDRDARVHPDRRAALDRLRRLLGRGAARPHQRRRVRSSS